MNPLEQAAVQQLHLTGSLSLSSLGGEASLIAERADVVVSRLLPEFTKALLAEWSALEDRSRAEDIIIDGLHYNSDDVAFLDTLDAVMGSPALDDFDAVRLADVLTGRARNTQECFNIRRFAIEGLLRLALWDSERSYDLLAVLGRLRENDDPKFLMSMPRLVGASYDTWHDQRLLPILQRLTKVPGCEVEGLVELGLVQLRVALEGNAPDTILAGLRLANACFADVLRRSLSRLDAKVFYAATAILIAFAEWEGVAQISQHLDVLEDAVVERRLWERNTTPREWLCSRIDAEEAWLRLGQNLKTLSNELRRPSWLDAVRVMINVLSVYEASRSYAVIGGDGVERIVGPRIEAAFLRREGLRHHLEQYLEVMSHNDSWRDVAKRLQERVGQASLRCDLQGRNTWAGRYPLLEAEFPEIAAAELTDSQRFQIEEMLRRYVDSGIGLDVAQSRILRFVITELRTCSDFTGEIANAFSTLVQLSLQFLADRQDIGREMAGDRMRYLFAWKKGESAPKERPLQMDYRDFLVGSLFQRVLSAELRDIAGGRADIVVDFRSFRFVVEAKRELRDASRDSLREYLGQAGLYQGTNVKLGFLLVLDLTSKKNGVPALDSNVWVEKVSMGDDRELRHVVVIRVPGNRIDPHTTQIA